MRHDITDKIWTSVKGEIQKTWTKLSPKDLDETKGDTEAIADLVSKKYGITYQDAENKLGDVIARCGTQASSFSKSVDTRILSESEKRFENEGGRLSPDTEVQEKGFGTSEDESEEQSP